MLIFAIGLGYCSLCFLLIGTTVTITIISLFICIIEIGLDQFIHWKINYLPSILNKILPPGAVRFTLCQ